MKCALFNQYGYGALTGRLVAPNEIVYRDSDENGGETLKKATLTGNVVETEFNDVVVVGKKISDTQFEVSRMESLPTGNEMMLFSTGTEEHKVSCLVAAASRLLNIEERTNSNGKPYHSIRLDGGKNVSVYVDVYGAVNKDVSAFVLVGQGGFKTQEKQVGSGYAVKTMVTKYGPASFQVGV